MIETHEHKGRRKYFRKRLLFRKNIYPRWTVLANFGLLSLLEPLAARTPAPVGAILVGGFTNRCITVFFLVSVTSTWNATNAYFADKRLLSSR